MKILVSCSVTMESISFRKQNIKHRKTFCCNNSENIYFLYYDVSHKQTYLILSLLIITRFASWFVMIKRIQKNFESELNLFYNCTIILTLLLY